MPPVKLSLLAIVMGAGVGLFQVFGLTQPARFAAALRKFPRSGAWGWGLMLLGTAWFLYNLSQESISDFAAYKDIMLLAFAAIGIGTCVYVKDFLAVRGLAVVLLLLGKLMVDSGRPYLSDTSWALVIQAWAYVLIFFGMWFTISPWRLRDFIGWATANEQRIKLGCGLRLAFGMGVLLLGLIVFRAVERSAG